MWFAKRKAFEVKAVDTENMKNVRFDSVEKGEDHEIWLERPEGTFTRGFHNWGDCFEAYDGSIMLSLKDEDRVWREVEQ